MAASVSRQFPALNGGAVHTFKSGPHHRSDSPLRGYNFPPSSELTVPKLANGFHEDDSSSDEEDENEYRDLIWKVNRELEPSILDPRDEGTADNWIVRNSTMVRLTGKHPFNAEAPLNRLMKQGFITPVPLHYVRNHGAVPKADWATWTVEVSGLVKRPTKFTMDQLVNDFPSRELPVTLVCAGNRRKEQNMVKKTIGFNWGPAGVSTSVWRGVPLRYVLKRCGIFGKNDGGLNVCFEGAEDLPGGGGSKYGTSIKKKIAMDPARDVILAYMQNGEKLLPDHGYPVRMIIPGFIGGRMVKWLKKITVTTKESENHYHFKDNRVLPSHVDPELATAEAWWYKPEYIINDLNINSVITSPGHEEILPINSWTTQRPYTLRGYAYSGGGKRVTRVEVTMNGGENWYVCQLDQPEKGNKYGKFWCWCFWSLEVEVLEILACKEIAVRAWDESLNTQPEKLTWNLMGMMNNCWFRVKTNVCRPHKGEIGMVFEHPTVPGNQSGGWMAKEKHLEASTEIAPVLQKSVSSPAINTNVKTFSMEEVSKHNDENSVWIVVHNHVYDCTPFLKDHPGGVDSILINAGIDCTEEFDAIHSDKAKKMLEDYRIGELGSGDSTSDSTASPPNASAQGASNTYSMSEISKHNDEKSAWIVVNNHVYDCTPFLKDHPGGTDSIIINAGTDCTEEFDAIHSDKAKKMLEDYRIGEVGSTNSTPVSTAPAPKPSVNGASITPVPLAPIKELAPPIKEIAPPKRIALVPGEKIPCKLIAKTSISHDVRIFRFGLPSDDMLLGLPVGKHIFVCGNIEGKLCMRAYTPSSTIDEVGFFELLVKVYFKNVHPKFPNGGLMSQYLDSLQLGDGIEVKGPLGHIEYTGRGNFLVHKKPKFAKKLAMIAGGTGITPIYQVVQAILKDPEDETEMYIVYANRTEDDILLREELDAWAEQHKRLKVWYVIQESIKEGWKYSIGFVTETILREHIPDGSDSALALVCGPPPMIQFAVQPNLEKMNYDVKESMLVF